MLDVTVHASMLLKNTNILESTKSAADISQS